MIHSKIGNISQRKGINIVFFGTEDEIEPKKMIKILDLKYFTSQETTLDGVKDYSLEVDGGIFGMRQKVSKLPLTLKYKNPKIEILEDTLFDYTTIHSNFMGNDDTRVDPGSSISKIKIEFCGIYITPSRFIVFFDKKLIFFVRKYHSFKITPSNLYRVM